MDLGVSVPEAEGMAAGAVVAEAEATVEGSAEDSVVEEATAVEEAMEAEVMVAEKGR